MQKENKKTRIASNTISLYAMNIAKMVLPLVTLPYLTRVMSKDCYGTVAYVKAVMQYMQLIVDFGFLVSGTRDIVKFKGDKRKLNETVSDIFFARIMLALGAGATLIVLTAFIHILKENFLYTVLSYIVVFMTCFLFDFFFRGIEQMQIIAIRFIVMKSIAAALTFVFVKSDQDLLWIPILDIIGSFVAIVLIVVELKKREVNLCLTSVKSVWGKIKESAVYFLSDFVTTAFNALNTLLIGIYIKTGDVANWSICMQLVGAVQSLYTPITNGIYPEMIRSKNYNLIKKTIKIIMPIVSLGCIVTFFVAKYALLIVGGKQYVDATPLLKCLIPVLFFSFPSMLYGWPTLGAIDKAKETTRTTVFTAGFQILGLIILIATHHFTLINIAILRGVTEFILFFTRYCYTKKFKDDFQLQKAS